MKKVIAFVVGLAMLVIVAAGCGGSPTSNIDTAIQKDSSTKAKHVDFNANLQVSGDSSALGLPAGIIPMNVTLSGNADVDVRDMTNPKAQGTINTQGLENLISAALQSSGTSASDAQTQAALAAGFVSSMDFVLVDQHLYLKLAGTWYDSGSLGNLPGGIGGTSTSAGTGTTEQSLSCLQGQLSDSSKYGTNLLSNINDVGKETISGQNSEHYSSSINMDAVLTQLSNTARDCGQAQGAGGLDAARGQIVSLFRTFSLDIWVGDDSNVTQYKVNIDLDPNQLSNLIQSLGAGSGTTVPSNALTQVTLTFTDTQSNFNGNFNIAKPSGTIVPLDQLSSQFGMGGGFGSGLGSGLGGGVGGGLGGGLGTGTSTSGLGY